MKPVKHIPEKHVEIKPTLNGRSHKRMCVQKGEEKKVTHRR